MTQDPGIDCTQLLEPLPAAVTAKAREAIRRLLDEIAPRSLKP
jgi:hypothetical protein